MIPTFVNLTTGTTASGSFLLWSGTQEDARKHSLVFLWQEGALQSVDVPTQGTGSIPLDCPQPKATVSTLILLSLLYAVRHCRNGA